MAKYDEIYGKKKKPIQPTQPSLFETSEKHNMICDGVGNDNARLKLKALNKPTFMTTGVHDFKCFICRQIVSSQVYFKVKYCNNCDIFHDPEDET